MTKPYQYSRDPDAGDDALDATGVMGSHVSGLRASVRFSIEQLDGNPETIRADIRRLHAADKVFARNWVSILELASDYREANMDNAYALWKKLPKSQRPQPSEPLDLAALDSAASTPPPKTREAMDDVAKKMIRAANDD
jgi:hypothetical protein